LGVLYIVSVEEGAGKTAIAAGIAINLVNAKKKVGYLKPQTAEKGKVDGDVLFMRKTLGLADIVNAPDIIEGRDSILVEARLGGKATDVLSKEAYAEAKDMKAKVIGVETYTGKPSTHVDIYKGFGDSFLGIVINKVPQCLLKKAKEEAASSPVKVLGVIPENRILLAVTVTELAESIKGKIVNKKGDAEELIENYMLGVLSPDSGVDYYKRKSNKAAVIRQERADMQLAALETPTAALVLAGSSQPPIYNVLNKADKKGVAVITTDAGINDIVKNIETTIAKARINQDKKLAKLGDMVKQNLDMKMFW
jgi:uncharacterized protein